MNTDVGTHPKYVVSYGRRFGKAHALERMAAVESRIAGEIQEFIGKKMDQNTMNAFLAGSERGWKMSEAVPCGPTHAVFNENAMVIEGWGGLRYLALSEEEAAHAFGQIAALGLNCSVVHCVDGPRARQVGDLASAQEFFDEKPAEVVLESNDSPNVIKRKLSKALGQVLGRITWRNNGLSVEDQAHASRNIEKVVPCLACLGIGCRADMTHCYACEGTGTASNKIEYQAKASRLEAIPFSPFTEKEVAAIWPKAEPKTASVVRVAAATMVAPDSQHCEHEWSEYVGFTEKFGFCKKCDQRRPGA